MSCEKGTNLCNTNMLIDYEYIILYHLDEKYHIFHHITPNDIKHIWKQFLKVLTLNSYSKSKYNKIYESGLISIENYALKLEHPYSLIKI